MTCGYGDIHPHARGQRDADKERAAKWYQNSNIGTR